MTKKFRKRTWMLGFLMLLVFVMMPTMGVMAASTKQTPLPSTALFDAKWYADQNPDVKAEFGYDAKLLWKHFQEYGMKEGRLASPFFNVQQYRVANPDLIAEFGDDWARYYQHYLTYGAYENANSQRTAAGILFNPVAYAKAYPDVVQVFGWNWSAIIKHFYDYGIREGRMAGTTVRFVLSADGSVITVMPAPAESDSSPKRSSSWTKKGPTVKPAPVIPPAPEPDPEHTKESPHTKDDFGGDGVCTKGCGLTKSEFQEKCEHEYVDGVCKLCDLICEHKHYTDGVCDECGMKCEHKAWTDGVCDTCGISCAHEVWVDGVCDACGAVCEHKLEDFAVDEACEFCGMTLRRFQELCTKYGKGHVELANDQFCERCGARGAAEVIDPPEPPEPPVPPEHEHTKDSFDEAGKCLTEGCDVTLEDFQIECGKRVAGHDWDADAGICGNCGLRCDHDWTDAEGNPSATCKICGMICEHIWEVNTGKCPICGITAGGQSGTEEGEHPEGYVHTKSDFENEDGGCTICGMTREQFQMACADVEYHADILKGEYCEKCGFEGMKEEEKEDDDEEDPTPDHEATDIHTGEMFGDGDECQGGCGLKRADWPEVCSNKDEHAEIVTGKNCPICGMAGSKIDDLVEEIEI